MAKGVKTGGRQKGTPNRVTGVLKDAILEALEGADDEGSVAYLRKQAIANPAAFMTLLGKVLPMQVQGSGDDGEIVHRIVLEGVRPK